MLLRTIKDEIVTEATIRQLRGTLFHVYQSIYHRGLDTMSGHAEHWGLPRETFRRSVMELVESGWIIRAAKKRRGDLLVPWMPLQVEQQVADEVRLRLTGRPYVGRR